VGSSRLLRRPFGGGDGGAAIDWLIVGLGNPGREYAGTPHNIGFDVADALAERWGLGRPKERFRGKIAEGRADLSPGELIGGCTGGASSGTHGHKSPRVAVLWPQTFMNDAGRSVGPARGSFKLPLERVLVVHDEIDLPFGEIRTRLGGGLAGHNGLKSIKRELGSTEFMRVRVGVGRPSSTDAEIVVGYVLGRFRESQAEVAELIERAVAAVELVLAEERE
jgi:peptidyl-tRNA hydrolase, PTH1 family